jgi:hypothetical protein
MLEPHAPKAVLRMEAQVAVQDVLIKPTDVVKEVGIIGFASDTLVDELRVIFIIHVIAVTLVGGVVQVLAVFDILHIVAVLAVLRVTDGVARATLRVDAINELAGQCFLELTEERACFLRMMKEIFGSLRILSFFETGISNTVRCIAETKAGNAIMTILQLKAQSAIAAA